MEGALKGIPVVKEESYMEQRYISKVKPLSQYILQVDFVSGSRLLLDMKPYLDKYDLKFVILMFKSDKDDISCVKCPVYYFDDVL